MQPNGPQLAYRFRSLPRTAAAVPGAGEILFELHAADHAAGGRMARPLHVARDVIERGRDALLYGSGPHHSLVLLLHATRPTLDDMLAACLVRHGWDRPGLAEFANYAAVVRQGYPVTSVLPERSLEGIFQAVRNRDGLSLLSLELSSAAATFLKHWRRLEQRILEAGAAGQSPFNDRLFDDALFAEERAFLQADREVFQRDVRRGKRWRVQLPGATASGSALLLFEPESLLFKHWSRYGSDCRYELLGVRWRAHHWVISTDPLECLSLRGLHTQLQQAEDAAGAGSWFDGERFAHTLIAAPKDGSLLSDQNVLEQLQQWLSARPLGENEGAPVDDFIELWPFEGLERPRHLYWAGKNPVFQAWDSSGQPVSVHVRGLDDAHALQRQDLVLARNDLVKLRGRIDGRLHPGQRRVHFCQRIQPALWIGRDLAGWVYDDAPLGSLAAWRSGLGSVGCDDAVQIARDVAQGLACLHALELFDLGLNADDIVLTIEQGALRAAIVYSGADREWPTDSWAQHPGSLQPGRSRDLRALGRLILFALLGHTDVETAGAGAAQLARLLLDAARRKQLRDAEEPLLRGLAELIAELASAGPGPHSAQQVVERLEDLSHPLPALAAQAIELLSDDVPSQESELIDTLHTPDILSDHSGQVSSGHASSSASAPPRVPAYQLQGRTLHGYHLDAELGRGAMGVVYQATHVLLGTPFAIKILLPSHAERPGFRQRFCNEALFLARIEHPHIIKVHDLFQSEGIFGIVSELAERGSLRAMIQARGALPEAEAAGIARQAALGLFAAAEQGIVHRDVKPANLLADAEGRIKVADFGIAKQQGIPGPTMAGAILGTPHYTAPEQCLATSSADHRSDIYSLGCTLYQLLSGRTPFVGGSAVEIMARHFHDAPPALQSLRPELSSEICELVRRCMHKDPERRFQTGAELADEIASHWGT